MYSTPKKEEADDNYLTPLKDRENVIQGEFEQKFSDLNDSFSDSGNSYSSSYFLLSKKSSQMIQYISPLKSIKKIKKTGKAFKTKGQMQCLKHFYFKIFKTDHKNFRKENIQELCRLTGFKHRQVYKWLWDEHKRITQQELTEEKLQTI